MEAQTTAQTVIPTIKRSDCKIVGIESDMHESNSKISYSDICGGFIKSNPNYATVTVKSGLTCGKLKEFDIATIDTSINRVNADGCTWLFKYDGRLLIREIAIVFTKDRQFKSIMEHDWMSEIFYGDKMQVIGRVVGVYTPFSSDSVQY